MKTVDNYLDLAKKKSGSDNQTSLALGLSRQAVSKWRKGNPMSEDNLIALAEYIDTPFEAVLASYHFHRTKSPLSKKAWARLGKSVAACILAAASIGYDTEDTYASGAEKEDKAVNDVVIIRSNIIHSKD